MNPDTEALLTQHIFVLATLSCKSVTEEHAALREAAVRIHEYERRAKNSPEASEDKMLAGMIVANILSPNTRKHVVQKEGTKDSVSK